MYDRRTVIRFLKTVLKKIDKSAHTYGDAYLLSDISKEWSEELVDLVGWLLMQVIRMKEVLEEKIHKNDLVFYDEFFRNQSTSFLEFLKTKIDSELQRRYKAYER